MATFSEAVGNLLDLALGIYPHDKELKASTQQLRFALRTNPKYVRIQIKTYLIDILRNPINDMNYVEMIKQFRTTPPAKFGDHYPVFNKLISSDRELNENESSTLMTKLKQLHDMCLK